MTIKESKVVKLGNGCGIYVPADIRKIIDIKAGDKVYFVEKDGSIYIKKK